MPIKSIQIKDLSIDSTLGGVNASDKLVVSQKAIKDYIDNSVSSVSIPTTGSGLTNNSNVFELGGTLTNDTLLTPDINDSYIFLIGNSSFKLSEFFVDATSIELNNDINNRLAIGSNTFELESSSNGYIESDVLNIGISSGGTTSITNTVGASSSVTGSYIINAYNASNGVINNFEFLGTGGQWNIRNGSFDIDMFNGSGSLTITDQRATTLGAQYTADYSLGFTDRSLIDKEYADRYKPIVNSNINISSGGDTTLTITQNKFYETFEYTLQDNTGTDYIRNFILSSTNASQGSKIRLIINFESTTDPSLSVRNLTSTGTILYSTKAMEEHTNIKTLEFIFDGTNWISINKDFTEPYAEKVFGTFLNKFQSELIQTEVNDGGHSTTRNDVNGFLHWTKGYRFRHWEDITISTSGDKIFDNLVANAWTSGSGASPNSTTDYFFPSGSLKEGMLIRWEFIVDSLNTSNGIIPQFNGTNLLTGNGIVMDNTGDYHIVIDMLVKEVSDTTGTILTTAKLLEDAGSRKVEWNEVATLDTVNDAYVDFEVFRDTDDLVIKMIDMGV